MGQQGRARNGPAELGHSLLMRGPSLRSNTTHRNCSTSQIEWGTDVTCALYFTGKKSEAQRGEHSSSEAFMPPLPLVSATCSKKDTHTVTCTGEGHRGRCEHRLVLMSSHPGQECPQHLTRPRTLLTRDCISSRIIITLPVLNHRFCLFLTQKIV